MQGPNSRVRRVLLAALAVVVLGSCNNSGGGSGGTVGCDSDECKLTASDAKFENSFGLVVSVSGDTAVVGASLNDEQGVASGAAYVFERDDGEWKEVQKIFPDDGVAGDRFGSAVSVNGDVMIIGARTAVGPGPSAGAAYIYRFDGDEWVQEQRLTDFLGATGDSFGSAVSISGDNAVVGAFRDNLGVRLKAGSASIFTFNGVSWALLQKISAADRTQGDFFGSAVAIDGGLMVIGAPGEEIRTVSVPGIRADTDSGAAYVFAFNGTAWTQVSKLKAQRAALGCEIAGAKSDFFAGDRFGVSVDVDGVNIVVGADEIEFRRRPVGGSCQLNTLVSGTGGIYVYRQGFFSTDFQAKLEPADPAPNQLLGRSVGIDGDIIVGGARGDSSVESFGGSAYVFRFDGADWAQDEKITASDSEPLDWFGESIAVDGDTAIVGAFGDDDSGPLSGAAYTFGL